MIPDKTPPEPAKILLYQTKDGQTRLEVRLQEETVWLTQKRMAELFQKNVRTINEHIQNIFAEGELAPESVIRNFRITADDGKSYDTQHYNLDVIISVGYRVKSHRGTQFRIWATQRLREYIVKGFAIDDERDYVKKSLQSHLNMPDRNIIALMQDLPTGKKRITALLNDTKVAGV